MKPLTSQSVYEEVVLKAMREATNIPYTDAPHKDYCPRQSSMPNNFGTPERKVTTADGLTGKQCYERFLDNMREAVNPDGTPRRWKLTSAQKTLAGLMWEVELKRKQAEQATVDASRKVTVVRESDDD